MSNGFIFLCLLLLSKNRARTVFPLSHGERTGVRGFERGPNPLGPLTPVKTLSHGERERSARLSGIKQRQSKL